MTQVILHFDEPMAAELAADPANYLWVTGGARQGPQTVACSVVDVDDTPVSIDPVSIDAIQLLNENAVAALTTHSGQPLSEGRYQLFACGDLEDLHGNVLEETSLDFTVSTQHLLLNPNVDQHIEEWLPIADSPAQVAYSADDIVGASTSGSVSLSAAVAPALASIAQCVELGPIELRLEGRVRIESPSLEEPRVRTQFEYLANPDCSGEPKGGASLSPVEAIALDCGYLWAVAASTCRP